MNPVEVFADYAAAARVIGRGGIPPERIRELAGREDGIDLGALQADATALAAAAVAAEDALSAERVAVGTLAAAWRGRSAAAAADLLERHCAAAAGAVTALGEASDGLELLRGQLTRQLDARAEAGGRIADRRAAEHPRWLACAAAVCNGTADDAAREQVADEIAPFVETDISGDWVGAMTSVTDAVAGAYRDAVAILAGRPAVRFDVPSGVVRHRQAPGAPAPAPASVPVGMAPLAAPPGPALADLPMGPGPLAQDLQRSDPWANPLGAGPDRAHEVEPSDTEPETEEAEDEPSSVNDSDADTDPDEPALDTEPAPAPETEPAHAPEPPPEPVAPPPSVPLDPLPAEAGFDQPTPCEIAADALPQVGR